MAPRKKSKSSKVPDLMAGVLRYGIPHRAKGHKPPPHIPVVTWADDSTENANLLTFLKTVFNHNLCGIRSIGMISDALSKDRGAVCDVARFLVARAEGLPVQIIAGRRIRSLQSPFVVQLLGMIEHAGIEGRNLVPADLTAMLEEVVKRFDDQCINIYGDKVPRGSRWRKKAA